MPEERLRPPMDASDATGLRFSCVAGCGFCCATSPGLDAREAERLPARLVVRSAGGGLSLALRGSACAALDGARGCTVYADRPSACRAFPVHLHALDRVQATLHRGCPGLGGTGDAAEALAEAALRGSGPAGLRAAARASETWREFRRRARAAGLWDEPDDLRAAARDLARSVWTAKGLARAYAALAPGDLAAADVAAEVAAAEPGTALSDILRELAEETFAGDLAEAVDPDLAWFYVRVVDGGLARVRAAPGAPPVADPPRALADLPLHRFRDGAEAVLSRALLRLADRDMALGAAAWLVDRTGYRVTLASAYARVLADQAGGLMLRAALLAAWSGADAAGPDEAAAAARWQETAFFALPTVGAVL